MPLRTISQNINGLNNMNKQIQLANFITYHRLDIVLIQEHNLRSDNLICRELSDICNVYINLAINQKGGTAIFINKKLDYKVIHSMMSADSRIISMNIKVCKQILHLVNVYAPASATHNERDDFFPKSLDVLLEK